jgi:hypothetical protein
MTTIRHNTTRCDTTRQVGSTDTIQSLVEYIDVNKVAALNNDTKTYIKSLLSSSSPSITSSTGILLSDESVDEQLIMIIPFHENVKIKSIRLYANESQSNDTQSAPKKIRIYANQPNVTFTDVDHTSATQEFSLTEAQVYNGVDLPLKLVKFNNIQSIAIFLENNQHTTPVTYLNAIEFYGTPIAGK